MFAEHRWDLADGESRGLGAARICTIYVGKIDDLSAQLRSTFVLDVFQRKKSNSYSKATNPSRLIGNK